MLLLVSDLILHLREAISESYQNWEDAEGDESYYERHQHDEDIPELGHKREQSRLNYLMQHNFEVHSLPLELVLYVNFEIVLEADVYHDDDKGAHDTHHYGHLGLLGVEASDGSCLENVP